MTWFMCCENVRMVFTTISCFFVFLKAAVHDESSGRHNFFAYMQDFQKLAHAQVCAIACIVTAQFVFGSRNFCAHTIIGINA